MADSHPFKIGTQVWTLYGEDWWPAKVIEPLEGNGPSFIRIRFYTAEGEETEFAYDPAVLEPFETSSSKAVTGNPDIQAAIHAATQDPDAVSMAHMAEPAAVKEPKAAAAAKKYRAVAADSAEERRPRRRNRDPENTFGIDDGDGGQHDDKAPQNEAGTLAQQARAVSDSELAQLAERVQQAVQLNSTAELRKVLLQLTRVKPSFRQLQSTRIGVTVSTILREPALLPLHPIVACILRFWMQELPEGTKDALRRYAEIGGVAGAAPSAPAAAMLATTGDSAVAGGGASSGAAASTDAALLSSAGGGASAQQQQQQQAGGGAAAAAKPQSKFGSKLYDDMTKNDAEGQNTAAAVAAFVRLAEETLQADPKGMMKLLRECSKPSHSALRAQLLTGTISLPRFLALSTQELMCPDEFKGQTAITEAIAWRAKEGQIEMIGSTLHECPECGKRNCASHEMQTRSADEPMTVFIQCLECGHNFKEGND